MSGAPPVWAVAAIAGVFGAMVGSFLNVVVYRLPLGRSLTAPRSFCPACRRTLAWWENVPVLAWLALRGRCRTCGTRIGPRYVLLEAGNGLMWAGLAVRDHGGGLWAAMALLGSTVLTVLLIETGGFRTPRSVALAGTAAATGVTLGMLVSGRLHWSVSRELAASAALVGSLIVVLLWSRLDPGALRPAAHGRSALIPCAAWLALAGARPAVVGGAAGIALAGALMIARVRVRESGCAAEVGDGAGACGGSCAACPGAGRSDTRSAPLVWALAAAMVAALV